MLTSHRCITFVSLCFIIFVKIQISVLNKTAESTKSFVCCRVFRQPSMKAVCLVLILYLRVCFNEANNVKLVASKVLKKQCHSGLILNFCTKLEPLVSYLRLCRGEEGGGGFPMTINTCGGRQNMKSPTNVGSTNVINAQTDRKLFLI